VRFAGDVGPSLAGIGGRMSAAQLRLRVADYRRVLPAAVMPSYYSVEGFDRVALPYRGKPILTALEVEDIVAYLSTLK
jgi:sulfur-oxidizing protein SoxX